MWDRGDGVTISCDVLARIERRVQSTYQLLHLKKEEPSVVYRNLV